MVSRVAGILVLALTVAVEAEIDFTPFAHTVEFEGIKSRQPGFRNGEAIVTFSPPSGWTVQGSGPELRLTPKESASSARVEARPLPDEAVTSEKTLKSCRAELEATLPRDAANVKWSEPELNPVLLNRHGSVRLEVSYVVFGQGYTSTVIACNLADQQLRFTFSSRGQDYERLYREFRQSLFTWEGLN